MNLKEQIIERLVKKRPTKVFSYIHGNGRIGAMLEIESDTDFALNTEELEMFAKDVCMQIAATNPKYIDIWDIPNNVSDEMYLDAVRFTEDKPLKAKQKIIEGKLNNQYKDICLLRQPWIKDSSKDLITLLDDLRLKLCEQVDIVNISRFGS